MKKIISYKNGILIVMVIILVMTSYISNISADKQWTDPNSNTILNMSDLKPLDLEPNRRDKCWNVELVGSCETRYSSTDVFVQGSYAYVTSMKVAGGYEGAFEVINVNDPENPWVGGSHDAYGDLASPVNLFILGSKAYVADPYMSPSTDSSFVYQFDISDPVNPSLDVKQPIPGENARAIFCQDDIGHLAKMRGGVELLVIPGLHPEFYGSTYTNYIAVDIFVKGNYAYVADQRDAAPERLTILDVSDPFNPYIIRECGTGPNPMSVYGQEGTCDSIYVDKIEYIIQRFYAYIADSDGLKIFDVTIPEDPYMVNSLELPGTSTHVYADEDYAYVTSYEWHEGEETPIGYLHVINILDPENPFIAGYYNVSTGSTRSVYTQGDLIYVAVAGDGLGLLILRYTGEFII